MKAVLTGVLFALTVSAGHGFAAGGEEYTDCLIEPHMVINVGSHAQGIISAIPVSRGDSIEKGMLLASLESEVERVEVELARARLDYLENQYQRLEKLNRQKMVSAEDFDETRIERNLARLELKRNTIRMEQKTIKSHVKGVVISRLLSPGEYVHEQSPILEIAQTDPLNVEVLLPVAKYRDVVVGQAADVTLAAPIGGVYRAEIAVIDRVLDAASSSFGIRLSLANPDLQIPAGLRCSIRFISGSTGSQNDKTAVREH